MANHANPETRRPFRIWNTRTKTPERGRNYASMHNAFTAALGMAYWGKPGDAFEVLDITRGHRLLMQYVRTPTSIRTVKP